MKKHKRDRMNRKNKVVSIKYKLTQYQLKDTIVLLDKRFI